MDWDSETQFIDTWYSKPHFFESFFCDIVGVRLRVSTFENMYLGVN